MEQEIKEKYEEFYGEYDENSSLYAMNLCSLGEFFVYGKNGVEKDYQKALYCFQKSSDLNYAEAVDCLGTMYCYGLGVDEDREKAFQLIQKAISMGCTSAFFSLGFYYLLEEDYSKAYSYFQEAADNGIYEGYYGLGYCYFFGYGVEEDDKKAFSYFKKAEEKNITGALYYLGKIYLYGISQEADFNKAYCYMKRASDDGAEEATYYLGVMYLNGLFVEQSYQKASDLILKSYQDGFEDALSDIGLLYYYGVGVKTDVDYAVKCFQEASDRDLEDGAKYLQQYYFLNGLSKDYKADFLYDVSEDIIDDPYFLSLKSKLMNDANVFSYNSIVEISDEELASMKNDDIVVIHYCTTIGASNLICDFYTVDDMKKIIKTCKKLLEEIDLSQPQEDIFMQIYIKLGLLLRYDENCSHSSYGLRTILQKNGVCLGISIVLKALLDMVGMESTIMFTEFLPEWNHAFNQVKLNDKWYYCDLTNDLDSIKEGEVEYCLLSKTSIQQDDNCHCVFNKKEEHEALEDYPDIESLFERNYHLFCPNMEKKEYKK